MSTEKIKAFFTEQDGEKIGIGWIVRYGKNGKKYEWEYPTQELADKLIAKYRVEQISGDTIWLNR